MPKFRRDKTIIMIDFETLSLSPDAHILQVAMIVSRNDEIITVVNLFTDPEDELNATRHVDNATVAWWHEQGSLWSDMQYNRRSSGTSLAYVINKMNSIINKEFPDALIVSRGNFDALIIESLLSKEYLRPHYRRYCDLRTLVNLIDYNEHTKENKQSLTARAEYIARVCMTDYNEADAHNALTDCIYQTALLWELTNA